MNTDAFVHQWLCQCRGILLVMTQFAEANDIDYDVMTELHAIVNRQLGNESNRFRIITVYVENGRFNHFDNVCTIQGRTHVAWIRTGEADLVINHDMNRATG